MVMQRHRLLPAACAVKVSDESSKDWMEREWFLDHFCTTVSADHHRIRRIRVALIQAAQYRASKRAIFGERMPDDLSLW